jgi:glycosyltransferase involved in cell wall biosynthesis
MARELNLGGSERQMTEIARFLDRAQFSPRVGCFNPAGFRGEELRASGVPVVQFPLESYKSAHTAKQARALVRYIREEHISLVHTFDYPLNVFAVPLTRVFTRAVAVSSQRSHRELNTPGYRRGLRISDRLAHAVVVNCRFIEKHMIQEEGVPPSRVQVCYNGIDLASFFPGQAPRSYTVGVVCGLHPWKGVSTLIEAFARLRQPCIRLVIIGDGQLRQDLEVQAAESGVAGQITFVPGIDRIADWLRDIEIFVLPSLSEALSNALMEAMACGCCVVASNVGGNPELVRHGETGMLFEKGDAASLAAVLRNLLANRELRGRLADNGLRVMRENCSIQQAARRMGEIYMGLLEKYG